jgi:hypothetical protein
MMVRAIVESADRGPSAAMLTQTRFHQSNDEVVVGDPGRLVATRNAAFQLKRVACSVA